MRIQQNYPATNFKAQLEIFNTEPRLYPIVEQNKGNWERQASQIGDDADKLCLTIIPQETQSTDIILSLFSSVTNLHKTNLYEVERFRCPEKIKDIPQDELESCLYNRIESMFEEMKDRIKEYGRK